MLANITRDMAAYSSRVRKIVLTKLWTGRTPPNMPRKFKLYANESSPLRHFIMNKTERESKLAQLKAIYEVANRNRSSELNTSEMIKDKNFLIELSNVAGIGKLENLIALDKLAEDFEDEQISFEAKLAAVTFLSYAKAPKINALNLTIHA
jgi:hypothetical protein